MKIIGLACATGKPLTLDEIDYSRPQQLAAIRRCGYRRFYCHDGSVRQLAGQAAASALANAGYKACDIDFIIAGQSAIPDFIGIDLACQTGAELRCRPIRTRNLVEGCATGVTAWLCAQDLVAHLQEGKVGLIILAQRISPPHLDRFGLMNAVLSDGAAAAIVTKSSAAVSTPGFIYRGGLDISDCRYVDMMRVERGGGVKPEISAQHSSHNDPLGRERIMDLYDFTSRDLGDFLQLRRDNTLNMARGVISGCACENDGYLFFLHTLEGQKIIEDLAKQLTVPAHQTNATLVSEIGHMGCVDPLVSFICMLRQNRIAPGDNIVMSTISTGMKWAACLFHYDKGGQDFPLPAMVSLS